MSEDRIGDLFKQYVVAEMSLIGPEYETEHQPYSRSYLKKIKNVFRAGKYFGGNIHLYKFAKRVAIFIIAFMSLFAAGEISARIFGVNPWNYLTKYLSDSKMIDKKYTGRNPEADSGKIPVPISDIPTYVPEGFEKTEEDRGKRFITMIWMKSGTKEIIGVGYSRFKIGKGTAIATDAEYKTKKKVSVKGIKAEYCIKGNHSWITWDDAKYNYEIQQTGIDDPENTLMRMAESIYSK